MNQITTQWSHSKPLRPRLQQSERKLARIWNVDRPHSTVWSLWRAPCMLGRSDCKHRHSAQGLALHAADLLSSSEKRHMPFPGIAHPGLHSDLFMGMLRN